MHAVEPRRMRKTGAVVAFAFLTLACSDMSGSGTDELGRLFTLAGTEARSWQLVELLEIDTAGTVVNRTDSLLACDADDITTFRRDDTYAITEGDTRCNPADSSVVEAGGFNFSGDVLTLSPTGAGASFIWQVEVLRDDSLRVRVPLGSRARIITYFPVTP